MQPHRQQLLAYECTRGARLVVDIPLEADCDAVLVRNDQRRRVIAAVALGVHQLRQEVHQGDELEPAGGPECLSVSEHCTGRLDHSSLAQPGVPCSLRSGQPCETFISAASARL